MLKKKNNIFVHTKKKSVMRIKYCFFFLFLLSFCKLSAQVDPIFTFSPWTQFFYNPGALGEKEHHLNFTGVLRQGEMFMTDNQAPLDPTDPGSSNQSKNPDKPQYPKVSTQQILLGIDSYIKKIRGAVGIMFLKDNGSEKGSEYDNIGFRLGYASKFRIRGGKLGIGLQAGFLNRKLAKDLNPNDIGDQTIDKATESGSYMDFDINFGILYKAPTWYVGVSGTQLLGGARISGETGIAKISRQFYLTGGYIWNLKTAIPWSIEPHLLIRTDIATWQLNVLAVARYNGILWFGTGYQNGGIPVLFGATPFYNYGNDYLKELEIGVAYTFKTAKYGYQMNGSMGDFELVVRYGFNFYKDKALSGYGSSRHLYKNQY